MIRDVSLRSYGARDSPLNYTFALGKVLPRCLVAVELARAKTLDARISDCCSLDTCYVCQAAIEIDIRKWYMPGVMSVAF